ncbi:hypothetical protein J6590_046701 [Homalodisca vitripennis]|nr:hypothetical protein J6590_046701 [Homalodisca vitripennis]
MVLEAYRGVLATAASTASFGLLLAPAFLCIQIWTRGSSKGIPFAPLMESMARSVLLVQQGIIMTIWPMIITHSIGVVLNLTYITIYLMFTEDKGDAKKCILRWSSVLAPITAYALYEDKTLVESRFANIATAFTIGMMLYHFYPIKQAITTKSTQNLPFPIIVAAMFVTGFWTLYGMAINKPILQIQTGFAFVVWAFELSLFAVFPSKSETEKQSDKKKKR